MSQSEEDYQVFKAIIRVAKNVGVTPFNVDALFWLVGSGNFHRDNFRVRTNRDKFIEFVRNRQPDRSG